MTGSTPTEVCHGLSGSQRCVELLSARPTRPPPGVNPTGGALLRPPALPAPLEAGGPISPPTGLATGPGRVFGTGGPSPAPGPIPMTPPGGMAWRLPAVGAVATPPGPPPDDGMRPIGDTGMIGALPIGAGDESGGCPPVCRGGLTFCPGVVTAMGGSDPPKTRPGPLPVPVDPAALPFPTTESSGGRFELTQSAPAAEPDDKDRGLVGAV